MGKHIPGLCPVCDSELKITEVACSRCNTVISGLFSLCPFCRLEPEDLHFVGTFIRCRGNIKEVEKALGISYPTVRSRLEHLIRLLELGPKEKGGEAKRIEVLEEVSAGNLNTEEAIKILKGEERYERRDPKGAADAP